MKPGLYALVSLDGSPLQPEDARVLGLTVLDSVQTAPGIASRIVDDFARITSTHFHHADDTLVALAGYLDEPEELAQSLGSASSSPVTELAVRALERFGPEAPRRLVGEWSLLRWSVTRRQLTLLSSIDTRDPVFWATNGRHIAVAPDPLLLGELPWVGLVLDPDGFSLSLGRAATRRVLAEGTLWKGVARLQPATAEVFSQDSRNTIVPATERDPAAWSGSFEEAIEELNTLGRRIVGQSLSRYGRAAFLLSGGLDSTLLTCFGAQERSSAEELICLTSVAPEDSGLSDERDFSRAVAEQLHLPVKWVYPPPHASVYQPTWESFAFYGEPAVPSRHYLQTALWQAAREAGMSAVFDGVLGEMTITEKPPSGADADFLRRMVYAARRWRIETRRRTGWPSEAFHARLSPALLHSLPEGWREVWRAGMPRPQRRNATGVRGFHSALAKNQSASTATAEGLRRVLPFRDRRLARFAAGLPYSFGSHNGQSRAMARALLRGRVPEIVRLRKTGMPFSPDYERRMQLQASATASRIELFREAGAGRWLDLDWLGSALGRLAAGADAYAPAQIQAQATAVAAEFLVWCRSLGVRF